MSVARCCLILIDCGISHIIVFPSVVCRPLVLCIYFVLSFLCSLLALLLFFSFLRFVGCKFFISNLLPFVFRL